MSFLGGESTEINPKYISKLIEARLYAIKDKKHYDGAIFTFYCPQCQHNNTILKPLFIQNLTMESFMHAVSSYRFEAHNCACGARLNHNNIVIALYSHLFMETLLDLQAEITAGSDFVRFYKMDMDGRREQISNSHDFNYMYETFGQVMSARECWKHMMWSARETRNIQLYNIEDGYVITAIPRDNEHPGVNLREIVGPMWPGDSPVVIRLRDSAQDLRIKESYRDWMPEFKDEIESGRIDTIVLMDTEAARNVLRKTLKREGMDFAIQGDLCDVTRRPFKAFITISSIIKEAAYRGRSLQEICDEKVEEAMNRIFSAENVYNTLRRDMASYEFSIDGDKLYISNPGNGNMESIELYATIPRGGLRTLVATLRESLSKGDEFKPVCKCGKEAFVLKSIEPIAWLSQSGNEASFDLVYDEKENAVVLYHISCGEHISSVRKTDLAEWMIDRKVLDEIFENELDSLRVNIEAHAGAFGNDMIIGALSSKACDIMVHPSFISGLLKALKVDIGSHVIVYAPLKEMVLIYRENAEMENLNEAVAELQRAAMMRDIDSTVLDYIEVMDLEKPRGIFNLITLPPRQVVEEREAVEEVQPESPVCAATPGVTGPAAEEDAEIIEDNKPARVAPASGAPIINDAEIIGDDAEIIIDNPIRAGVKEEKQV